MLIGLLLIGFAAILIYGFATQNNEAKVDLRIATFGLDVSVYDLRLGSVYDLRLGYNSFSIFVDYDNSGNKIQHFGNTIEHRRDGSFCALFVLLFVLRPLRPDRRGAENSNRDTKMTRYDRRNEYTINSAGL